MTEFFLKILNMSITAGWLILAVILLRLVLRGAPKTLRYILWALVAVRLLFPISFESTVSLVPSAETVPESVLYESPPTIHTGLISVNTFINPMLQEAFPPAASGSAADAVSSAESASPVESLLSVCAVVWACGTAAMLVYCIISYALLRHRVNPSVRLRDKVWISDGIPSPFILGFFRPRIYIPSNISDVQLNAVEAHERMHLRHADHLWKMLGFLVLAVYWWNPLIWVAYILFCRDIELICDEAVIKKMEPSERKEYSEALLSFNMPRRLVSACPLAFGELGVKERIRSVMSYKKPGFWIIIVAAVACIVTAVCFLTNPIGKSENVFANDRLNVGIKNTDSVNGDSVNVQSDELKVGDTYTLPGYGDIDEITLTVESLKTEGKIAVLKLSHPLFDSRHGGAYRPEETDTVRLMMDHTVYEGIGYDSVTLLSPDGTKQYTFSHTMSVKGGADAPDNVQVSDKPTGETSDLLLPDPSEYDSEKLYVTLYDTETVIASYFNTNDMVALEFYKALDADSFELVTLEDAPKDMQSYSLVFGDGINSFGDYTVYENDIVCYGIRSGDGSVHYFKAAEGTFKKVKKLAVTAESKYYSGDTMLVLFDGDEYSDVVKLVYSREIGFYILSYNPAYFDGFGMISGIIYTNIKDYSLYLVKTDEGKLGMRAIYDGKEHYYDIREIEGTPNYELVAEDGSVDFIMLFYDSASGTIEVGHDRDLVRLNMSPFPGTFSFSLKVTTETDEEYESAYIPDGICNLSLFRTDENEVKLLIEKNGEVTYADICIENGSVVLKGAPDGFGSPYNATDIDYKPGDFYESAFTDIDKNGLADTVYVTKGPLSGRYSVTVSAICSTATGELGNKIAYKSSFAYDEKCEFAFEKENDELYLIVTPEDSDPLRYKVTCNAGGVKMNPEFEDGGTDIFKKINDDMINEDNAFLSPYISISSDIDGDGEDEAVSVGPGMFSGLSSFSVIIADNNRTYGPTSYVSDSISQTLVKDDNGKVYIRAEYEDNVIFYGIEPNENGQGYVIADKNGEGIR